ncbi:MAG: hypothetical protein ABGX31_05190 [bacterium]
MKLDPIDATQRALGGVGLSTRTPTILPGDPTASLDLLASTASFTLQPMWGSYKLGVDEGEFSGTRFPILGMAFPLGTSGVATFTLNSFFDQNSSAAVGDTLQLMGADIPITDQADLLGGLSALRMGWAQRFSSSIAIGASAGVYTGSVKRNFVISFDLDSLPTLGTLKDFSKNETSAYSGPLVSVNLSWNPHSLLQLGGSVQWSGVIALSPIEGSIGEKEVIRAPIELKVASNWILGPGLFLNAGLSSSDWSNSGYPGLDAVAVGRTNTYGIGLEWEATRFWSGIFPLRLGFRKSTMPFQFKGQEVKERNVSLGFSVVLAEVFELPIAAIDVAVEAGKHSASDFEENFNRVTVTLRAGNR